MNYYDEEIEINRESTKETSHIAPSTNSAKPLKTVLSKDEIASVEGPSNRQNETDLTKSNNNNVNNISNSKNKENKIDETHIESSESETDEEATQNDEVQQKNYSILTSEKWKNLPIPQDLKDIMQNILKYAPQTIETEYKLQPFIPDFVPSVGDVDAFLKVSYPDTMENSKKAEISDFMLAMGLVVLDEPSGRQSDPNLLSMKLRSVFTNSAIHNIVTKVPTARSTKDIDKWINEIEEIHRDQSVYRMSSIEINDEISIDSLMAEWPKSFEIALNEEGFPQPELDCSLEKFLKIVSSIFDIPIFEDQSTHFVQAIHVLFNLYLAINETEDFK
ncbi:intraflagellar transport protein 46 homolog [Condylostylus longicornis]|uniref:intraflagellar transport protein 46 homolog n=1 Tax=Condylostylus longicornis TaxID=2530218 RepID=UPI00244DBCE0|nr:intraflagellar transport protein 46 homolog [Condylostylus longicornis]